MENICCFAGHGKMNYGEETRNQVYLKCRELVADFGVKEFWVGHYGDFDKLAASVIRELKQQYPAVRLNLVIPYLTKGINENKEYYYKNYDAILMAQIPDGTPRPYRILKCNEYMVNEASYLIAYVSHSFGGAAKTLAYASRREHIKIFNFANQ